MNLLAKVRSIRYYKIYPNANNEQQAEKENVLNI